MIVPTPCQGAKCQHHDASKLGYDDETNDDIKNPVCESIVKHATNMKNAGVCTNSANLDEVKFTQFILRQCGGKIPKADVLKYQLSPQDKTLVVDALACTSRVPACKVHPEPVEQQQVKWMDYMEKCVNEKSDPAQCVSSARPLDCTTTNKQEYLCSVFKEALNDNCEPTTPANDFKSCEKIKWTTPAQLATCLSKLECTGVKSKKPLKQECVEKCYGDNHYDDIKNDRTQLEPLKRTLSDCIANSNECPATTTPGGNTAAPVVPPKGNSIKPSNQGNNDNEPTSMPPKDQDVTSDEDEGCMVRANSKIIIAFAATFVVISFLKALPVEN